MSQLLSSSYFYQRLLRFSLYFLVFLLPLIWTTQTSELFEFPKMVFVYAMTIIIITLWAFTSLFHGRLLFRRSPLDLPLALFLLSQLISTLLSIHPQTSLFGYYSRFHGGLYSTLSYSILFYAALTHLNRSHLRPFIYSLLAGGIFAALYALPEHFGFAFSCWAATGSPQATCWVQDVQHRIFGTFGQPNWLAAYIISLLPLTWSLYFKPSRIPYHRLLWLGVHLLFLAVLVFTRSRSGLLGFLVSFSVFTSLQYLRHRLQFLKPALGLLIPTLLLVLATGTPFTPSVAQLLNLDTTPPPPPLTGSVLESGDITLPANNQGGTESGQIREIVWRGALDVFLNYPLFGSGVETFAYSYYNHRPQSHNLVSEWDFLYNKAHNELLNYLSTTGIFGLATYLLLVSSFIYFALKHFLHTSTVKTLLILLFPILGLILSSTLSYFILGSHPLNFSPQTLILHFIALLSALALSALIVSPSSNKYSFIPSLISGFLALFVSNFFGFSTVSVGLAFFLLISLSFLIILPPNQLQIKLQDTINHPSHKIWVIFSLILFLSIFSLYRTYIYLKADQVYAKAQSEESSGQLFNAYQLYQQAVDLSPNQALYHSQLADTLSKLSLSIAANPDIDDTLRATQVQELLNQTYYHSSASLTLNPVHLNLYKTQAGVYIRLSNLDPDLLDVATNLLTEASRLAPTDAKLRYNLGLIALDQDATPSAQEHFQAAVNLKPNYEAARLELASILLNANDTEAALTQYQFILNYINPESTPALEALETLKPTTE